MRRVQQLVGDLQKQRQELSVAVRQLTDKSQSLGLLTPSQQNQSSSMDTINGLKGIFFFLFYNVSMISTNYLMRFSYIDSSCKVRNNSIWLETDLDNNTFVEHGTSGNTSTKKLTPLYIDTQSNTSFSNDNKDNAPSPIVSDELSQNNMFSEYLNQYGEY